MTRGVFLVSRAALKSLRQSMNQVHTAHLLSPSSDRAEMDAALADLRRAEARLLAQLERANESTTTEGVTQ